MTQVQSKTEVQRLGWKSRPGRWVRCRTLPVGQEGVLLWGGWPGHWSPPSTRLAGAGLASHLAGAGPWVGHCPSEIVPFLSRTKPCHVLGSLGHQRARRPERTPGRDPSRPLRRRRLRWSWWDQAPSLCPWVLRSLQWEIQGGYPNGLGLSPVIPGGLHTQFSTCPRNKSGGQLEGLSPRESATTPWVQCQVRCRQLSAPGP